MTNDGRYNGWTNYQTWNVMLWLDNVEGMYRYYREAVRRIPADEFNADHAAEIARAAFGGTHTRDNVALDDPQIDWDEIADAMKESVE